MEGCLRRCAAVVPVIHMCSTTRPIHLALPLPLCLNLFRLALPPPLCLNLLRLNLLRLASPRLASLCLPRLDRSNVTALARTHSRYGNSYSRCTCLSSIASTPCSLRRRSQSALAASRGPAFWTRPTPLMARADDGTSMPELLGSVMLNREGAGPSHLRAPRWQGQGPLGSNVSHPKGNDG